VWVEQKGLILEKSIFSTGNDPCITISWYRLAEKCVL